MSGRQGIRARLIAASMLVAVGLTAPAVVRAGASVDLDQWASSDQRMAERQPQRQQQPVSRGRHRSLPSRVRGADGRQPLNPHQLRLHGQRAQGVRLPRDLERHERRGQDLYRERWRHLIDVPDRLPGSSSPPPSRRTPFKANGLSRHRAPRSTPARARRLTIWGGTITLDQPAQSHAGSRQWQQLRRHRSSRFTVDRVGCAARLGRPSRPVARTGTRRGGGASRRRLAQVSGRAMAHADAAARRRGQQEPGPQHPAERHRRRAATPRALAPDPASDTAPPRAPAPSAWRARRGRSPESGETHRTASEPRSRMSPDRSGPSPHPRAPSMRQPETAPRRRWRSSSRRHTRLPAWAAPDAIHAAPASPLERSRAPS